MLCSVSSSMAQMRQSGSERFLARSYDSESNLGHKLGLRRRYGGRSLWSNLMILFAFSLLLFPIVTLITISCYHKLYGFQDMNKYNGNNGDLGNALELLSNKTGSVQFVDAHFSGYIVNSDDSAEVDGEGSKNGDRDDIGTDDKDNGDQLEIPNIDGSDVGNVDQWTKTSKGNRKVQSRIGYNDDTNNDDDLDNDDDGIDDLIDYGDDYRHELVKDNNQLKMRNVTKEVLSASEIVSLGTAEVKPKQGGTAEVKLDQGTAVVKPDHYSQDANIAGVNRHDGKNQISAVRTKDEVNGEKSRKPRSHPNTVNVDKVETSNSRKVPPQNRRRGRHKSPPKHVSSTKDRHPKNTGNAKKPDSRRPPSPPKRSGRSCEMKFLNSTAQLVEPSQSPRFSKFSLQYTEVEERPEGQTPWEPRFAGHQTFEEREDSFYATDKKINCGFVKGPAGSSSTGFDMEEDDARFLSSCHIAVSSCIFGNSDYMRSPSLEMITSLSRKRVCFVMFTDENTLQTLSLEGQKPDSKGFIGLWKVVAVKNLPYSDMRRVGKVPKFLAHRIFPHARYSIWLDSKLLLQRDPFMLLEYFLWRQDYEYAISNHYDRHCVWEEVAQNKKLNKYDPTAIDLQFWFYQGDGLKRFNGSDPNNLLPSNVPEGSFIVREHTPMSNLFSCLWFNEVDRFTSRDQLSFAYVYHKLRKMNPDKPFRLNMFKDCERRSIARLFHHRPEDKRNVASQGNRTNVAASAFR